MRKELLEIELGEVFNITYGKGLPTSKLTKEGFPVFGANGVIGHYTEYKYEEKQVLISCRGAASGKINISPEKCFITNNSLVIESNSEFIHKKFLYFILSGANRSKIVTGSAQPQVTINNANTLLIKLAPLPIQRAIVSKIEALFSDLDNGIANFKTAQEQLKIYRQAVLKKAFEGGFSITNEELRITNKEDNLPKEWKWVKLGEVTEVVEKVKRKEKNDNDEFIYLDIGGIDNSINKIVSHKNYLWKDAPSRAQQIVKVGDTLFSTVRTYLKNIAFVEKEIYENQVCSSGFSVIRAKDGVSIPKYLFYYSIFEEFIRPLNEMQKGSSYPAIRSEDVFNQSIHIPLSIEEQIQIVQEIESRLSVCDKMEQSLAESIEKAEALRQSILKKAFEGKLLSEAELAQCKQAADYEPASELLKKIQAEKLAKEQEKKKPTVKKRSKK